MKKFYVSLVVMLLSIGSVTAQNFFWIGGANGDWTNTANWSNTQGGSTAGAFPSGLSADVYFPANATVQLNTSVSINSVSVINSNTTVVITAVGGGERTITVNSTSIATPGLNIAASCKLENSATGGTEFKFEFVPNGQGVVNGEWYFSGDVDLNDYAYFELPSSGAGTAVNINNAGSVSIGPKAITAPNITGDFYLLFNAGSFLNLYGNGGYAIVPPAKYSPSSTINVTGITDAGLAFEELESVGNINYNCPAQSNGSTPLSLGLSAISVDGNLNILNTNNNELTLILYYPSSGLPSMDATIKGNLNIQGNSVVSVAHNDGPELPNNLTVNGNLIANGTSLSIHTGPFISSSRTKLIVKGNVQHTSGTFSAASTVINNTSDLYILELAGNTNQNISSVTGTFDNTGHQVTLRMNNTAGATLLNSMQIGRIDFNSANKGVLSTGSNLLTINNTTPVSVSSIVVNSPSDLGYVSGNVQRKTASVEPFVIPSGGGAKLRSVTVIPSTNAPSTYQSTFFNSAYSNLSVVSPLEGVSPDYYWDVTKVSGTDASIQLSVNGAVTGSQSNYGLIVAKYNGSDWVNAKGTTGTMVVPGTATSGTLRSESQTTFGLYTIGYALQSALPTLLVSFEGKKTMKESADIKWQITTNSTPETFEVMRSADGINFNKIGSVAGREGILSYQFTDPSILSGNNYYRLRMLDRDGSTTYSIIIIISNGTKGVMLHAVAPTLVSGRTKLTIQSSANNNMQLVVTDINGRIVHKQSVSLNNGTQDVWLDASRFSAGMFQVTGYVNGEKTATLRFIKL